MLYCWQYNGNERVNHKLVQRWVFQASNCTDNQTPNKQEKIHRTSQKTERLAIVNKKKSA